MESGYAPHNTYPCEGEDLWIAIAVSSEDEWQKLVGVMDNPSWSREHRFGDQLQRWKHRSELDEFVGQWTRNQNRDQVVPVLQQAGVAASVAYRQSELVSREHNQRRGTFVTLDHPTLAGELIYGLFWKLSHTPGAMVRHAPLLGQHNAEVLNGLLGLADKEITRLEETGVLY